MRPILAIEANNSWHSQSERVDCMSPCGRIFCNFAQFSSSQRLQCSRLVRLGWACCGQVRSSVALYLGPYHGGFINLQEITHSRHTSRKRTSSTTFLQHGTPNMTSEAAWNLSRMESISLQEMIDFCSCSADLFLMILHNSLGADTAYLQKELVDWLDCLAARFAV